MSDSVYNNFSQHHAAYEAKNLSLLLKEYKKIFASIPFGNITAENAEAVVLLNIDKDSLKKVFFKISMVTGLAYGRYVAKQIRDDNPIQKKGWEPLPFFDQAYQQRVVDYYNSKGGQLITSVTGTIADRVRAEIINGGQENESTQQMRDRIHKTVNDPKFYKWQAMRIARTETTHAMNHAKQLAGDTSGVEFEKVWIARIDGHERGSHESMNGKKVGQDEYFVFKNGVELLFPGDRDGKGSVKAIASEVINCRCTYGYEAKRDANGRLIFKDEEIIKPAEVPVQTFTENDEVPSFVTDQLESYRNMDNEIQDLKTQYDDAENLRRESASKVNTYYQEYKKKFPKKTGGELHEDLKADEVFQALRKESDELAVLPSKLNKTIREKEADILAEGYKDYRKLVDNLDGEGGLQIRGSGTLVNSLIKDFKKISKGYNDGLTLTIGKSKGREGFNSTQAVVLLNSSSTQYTVIHEFAHSLELDPRVLKQSVDFFMRRTAGNPVRSLDEVNRAYRGDEYFKEGGFYNPYVGKFYKPVGSELSYQGISATEIISMGIEKMYRNPTVFFLKDPDHFRFIYNLFFKKR